MNDELYLEVYECENFYIKCPLETLITLNVFQFCHIQNIKINLVVSDTGVNKSVRLNLKNISHNILTYGEIPWQVSSCKLPVFTTKNRVITGLCAVSRQLTIYRESSSSIDSEHPEGILGFRKGCLQAPNEVSVWTKFCEVEILEATYQIIKENGSTRHYYDVPQALSKFEKHLGKPLRIHNISKIAQDFNASKENAEIIDAERLNSPPSDSQKIRTNVKQRKWKSSSIKTATDYSVLEHTFAEGPFLTLADVVLYPCYFIIFTIYTNILENVLPKTIKWFKNFESTKSCELLNINLDITSEYEKDALNNLSFILPQVEDVSLYKCDPKRSNPRKNKKFTKEDDVEAALHLIGQNMEMTIENNFMDDFENTIDWLSIPSDAKPHGGHLPDKRKDRKTQQLENLALIVMRYAKSGDKIIDFCSGSGHLGILLAHLLPDCTIILLENKEESLNRAGARVDNLKLKNVYLFQCNLDYYTGRFDIGVALHACGVATDLVLENCISKDAFFVVCPCCYGSLHVTKRLHYPRSQVFSKIPIDKYMCIGHAADQTHSDHPLQVQGIRCMAIIDSDRAHYAKNKGYAVHLTRLFPLNCTPKNMVIVGIKE